MGLHRQREEEEDEKLLRQDIENKENVGGKVRKEVEDKEIEGGKEAGNKEGEDDDGEIEKKVAEAMEKEEPED